MQQNNHNSPDEKSFARPFTKVRFVYPNEESGQFQVPFTLLTNIESDKPLDQYHPAPEISLDDEVTQPRVPIIPFPDLPVTPTSAAPATSLPEVPFTPQTSIFNIRNILIKRNFISLILQLARFCIVGGLNTFIDILIFNLLIWRFPTHDNIRLLFYNSLAYMIGAINSFCWNKLWTFKHRSHITINQLVRFALVTGLGIICNDAFLGLATTILTSLSLTSVLWTNVAKISAIAGSVAVSYLGMRFSVFTKKSEEPIAPPPSNPQHSPAPHSLSVIMSAYNEEA